MNRKEFGNPVERVMFILGFKHDPKFGSALDAMQAGSNPGTINALELLTVYRVIDANFSGMRATLERIHEHLGSNPPASVKESVYEIIVEEIGEKQYGGKWFSAADKPPEHWISLEGYSPVFRRGVPRTFFRRKETEVFFFLPAPYFRPVVGRVQLLSLRGAVVASHRPQQVD